MGIMAIVSNDVIRERFECFSLKDSDNKSLSPPTEKLREPMIKCKHLFICSGATLIRSIIYTSDKRVKRKEKYRVTQK